jgi:hypothetical protein
MPYQDPYANSGSHFQQWTPQIDTANQNLPGGVGQYRQGGPNKIVWGGDVTAGTSGGETAWNPETNSLQYVTGYDNTGWNPPGMASASSDEVTGSLPASARPDIAVPQSAPAAPSTTPPASVSGLSAAAGVGGGVGGGTTGGGAGTPALGPPDLSVPSLGGTGSNVTPPSMTGLASAAGGDATPASGAGAKELTAPGGLKQGLGTRIPPSLASLFADRAY